MSKGIVVHLQGGLGKCIIFTAVAKCFKETYPDKELIVISGFPEVFVNNPNVDHNYGFITPELWQRYYGNPDYEVFAQDPYMEDDWIKNKSRHLSEIWCQMLGLICSGTNPELFFSGPELDELNLMIQTDKPICVVQSSGGANPKSRSWTRNPPRGEFDEYLSQYLESHFIVHLCVPDTPGLQNIHQRIDILNRRQAMCLVYYAPMFIGIDSYGMHTRAANSLSGATTIFLPLAESKERLGYPHKNWNWVVPRPEIQDKLRNHTDYFATVFKLNIDNSSENCPVLVGEKWFNT